jgi:hypothetical protein
LDVRITLTWLRLDARRRWPRERCSRRRQGLAAGVPAPGRGRGPGVVRPSGRGLHDELDLLAARFAADPDIIVAAEGQVIDL